LISEKTGFRDLPTKIQTGRCHFDEPAYAASHWIEDILYHFHLSFGKFITDRP